MYMLQNNRNNTTGLMDLFDEFEHSLFGESGRRTVPFSTDIKDEGDHYLLQAELPGFQKEDIDLDVKDGLLTISATHQEENTPKQGDSYLCRERRFGSFTRSFSLDGIQEDGITASYQNGVLELVMPKRQEVLPQSRKIAIQ